MVKCAIKSCTNYKYNKFENLFEIIKYNIKISIGLISYEFEYIKWNIKLIIQFFLFFVSRSLL